MSCLNFSFPEWGFNLASEEQKVLRDSIVRRMNHGNSKERIKALHWKWEGRIVMWDEEVMLNTVGHNSSFFLMTHTHTHTHWQANVTVPYHKTFIIISMHPGGFCLVGGAKTSRLSKPKTTLSAFLSALCTVSWFKKYFKDSFTCQILGRIIFAQLGTGYRTMCLLFNLLDVIDITESYESA